MPTYWDDFIVKFGEYLTGLSMDCILHAFWLFTYKMDLSEEQRALAVMKVLAEGIRKQKADNTTINHLFCVINRITAPWRHTRNKAVITALALDDLSEVQVEAEEVISRLQNKLQNDIFKWNTDDPKEEGLYLVELESKCFPNTWYETGYWKQREGWTLPDMSRKDTVTAWARIIPREIKKEIKNMTLVEAEAHEYEG